MQKLIKLSETLHWIKIGDDGVLEIYLDNHSLQTFRACEGAFYEKLVKGYGSTKPIWFLSLGTCMHKCIEFYYAFRKQPWFSIPVWAAQYGTKVWYAMAMDRNFKDYKEYQMLGGQIGFTTLLLQYAGHFNTDNERFRVIGTELYFGKSKEVPILVDPYLYTYAPFRLYLSGKIDLLIDDGEAICPMDHKTKKDFRGQNPSHNYEIQDGMTGYVYAARYILANYNSDYRLKAMSNINRKPANKIWMNFLQIKPTDKPEDRLKRYPIYKTEQQLEDYRMRQIRTASNIFSLLTNPGAVPQYNDMMCTNWMHGDCAFQPVHRLGSTNHELILNADFVKLPIWNPEEPTLEDRIIGELK